MKCLAIMKKFLTFLVFLCPLFFANALIAQARPKKEDEQPFLQYVKPTADSLNKAFTYWQYVKRGVIKGLDEDSLNAVVDMLRLRIVQREIEYITQHPNSYASLYHFNFDVVNSSRFSIDTVAAMYSRFSKDLQATALGKSIDSTIRKKKSLALNKEMPLFTFRAHTGQKINLSSFRQKKYVLLCFWDSWCAPCIRNIPMLKALYKEYHEKGLELISVSLDKHEQKWIASVEKYAMPWLQTVDLPSYISGDRIQSLYDIHYIPQYFLLDKEGKLIYHNFFFNEDDDYTVLRQMLARSIK